MRKIRDIIRLHSESRLSANRIALSLNVARSVVQECLRQIRASELTWPLPADLDDNALELKLYPREPPVGAKTPPDWPYVHQQLREKAVTLELLWHEYQAQAPMPYSYGQFCYLYRKWANKLNLVMRQDHKAGDKLFVDWSGKTAAVTDPETGEVKQAQVFVAVWGASSYTYAEACWSQEMHNWIGAHVRAFEYFGGVPALVVPDCTKTAVTKYDRWDRRDGRLRKHSTYREHMPRAHQSYLDWTTERLVSWAAKFDTQHDKADQNDPGVYRTSATCISAMSGSSVVGKTIQLRQSRSGVPTSAHV